MKFVAATVTSALLLAWAGSAAAQGANANGAAGAGASGDAPTLACRDVMNTPAASAEDIAALNDQSQVEVVRCRDADAGATPATPPSNLQALRAAVTANPAISTRLAAAGAAPEQVVSAAPAANGAFTFYVIGAFR
jgi:hypothetical protein